METISNSLKIISRLLLAMVSVVLFNQCSNSDAVSVSPTNNNWNNQTQPPLNKNITYLALGDSYTIGQSVCATCRFPEQLKKRLETTTPGLTIDLKIIAQTGWTTTNLIKAINEQQPANNYQMVSLLIGVNNQFQNKDFSIYEREFPELVNRGIFLARGDKSRVIVVSIPDYAFTPFGQQSRNPEGISTDIDRYNAFAKRYCDANGIAFVNITDITRQGLKETYLVALDGLHPSEKAYELFVNRMVPLANIIVRK